MLQEDDVNVDAFVDLVAKNEQSQAQENGNQKGFNFPTTVGVGSKAIVRFVNGVAESATDQGKPGSGRAKLFNIGWVKDDNGKVFKLVLPAIIKNKPMYPHLMLDFIDKVLARTWVDDMVSDDGKKGGWKYFYAERDDRGALGEKIPGQPTLKSIYWNVFKSGAQPSSQYYRSQKSWRGQTIYVANVIDRLDYKWHQDNKKTKLLMRKVDVKDGQIRNRELSWYAVGDTMHELTDSHGIKLNYDVLILPGSDPKDKFTMKNVSKLKEVNYWDDIKNVIVQSDIDAISMSPTFTDEEKTWETIDIGKYYKFTSAKTILEHFGKTIEAFDMMTGNNFLEQFKAEAALEKKASGGSTTSVNEPLTNVAPQATVVSQPAPVEKPVVTQAAPSVAPTPSFDQMNPAPNVAPPEPTSISPEAQQDISSFYDSLDD